MKTFKQYVAESKIEDDLYKHKLEGLKDIHGDVHIRHSVDENGRHNYKVYHQGNKIASAKLSGQDHYVSDVDVKPEFRRKGIATKMYDFIEKHSGKKLKPSPMHQTPDGKALWKKRLDEKVQNYRDSYYGLNVKGKGYGKNNSSTYDDEYVSVEPDKLDDENGKTIGWKHRLVPKKGTVTSAEDIIPKSDGVIHRGMSHAEYKSIMKHGKIKSRGSGNIGKEQEGLTYFTKDPAAADTYSNAFAQSKQKPTHKKPAYIVSVRKPDASRIKHVEGTAEHEVGVHGDISADDIVAVHKGQVITHSPATKGSSASSMLHWKRIK